MYRERERWRKPAYLARAVVGRRQRLAGGLLPGAGRGDVPPRRARSPPRWPASAPISAAPSSLTDAVLDQIVERAGRLAAAGTTLGEALLDQRIAAGIGNVYKSEACFAVGVDPATPIEAVDEPTAPPGLVDRRPPAPGQPRSGRAPHPPGRPGRLRPPRPALSPLRHPDPHGPPRRPGPEHLLVPHLPAPADRHELRETFHKPRVDCGHGGGAEGRGDRSRLRRARGRPSPQGRAGRGDARRPAQLPHLPAAALPGGHRGAERRRRRPRGAGPLPRPGERAVPAGAGDRGRLGRAHRVRRRPARPALRPPRARRRGHRHLLRHAGRGRARLPALHAGGRHPPAEPRRAALRGGRHRSDASSTEAASPSSSSAAGPPASRPPVRWPSCSRWCSARTTRAST